MYRNTIPNSTNAKSNAFAFRFFSWNITAPNRKLTMTLPMRTIDTMDIIAAGRLSE